MYIDVLGFSFDMLSMGVCTTTGTDVRSTGVGIKRLHCSLLSDITIVEALASIIICPIYNDICLNHW